MPQFETLKAWIEVDGVPLDEFEVSVDQRGRKVECYVPSEVGKVFVVGWSWQGTCASEGRLTVDGFQRPRVRLSGPGKQTCSISQMNLPHNDSLGAEMKFGDILMTDDDSLEQNEHLVKALGSIELEVQTGLLVPRTAPAPKVAQFDPRAAAAADITTIPEQSPIHERSKKLGSHRVVFGAVKPVTFCQHVFLRHGRQPTRFVFLYRSKDILVAQGIMSPRSSPAGSLGKIITPTPSASRNSPNRVNTTTAPRVTSSPVTILEDCVPTIWARRDSLTRKGNSPSLSSSPVTILQEGIILSSASRKAPKREDEDTQDGEEETERRLRALEEQAVLMAEQATTMLRQAAAISEQLATMKELFKKRKSDGAARSGRKRPKVEGIDARAVFRPGEVIDISDD